MENASMPDRVKYQKMFMGIILASFTHELRNQLAVVKELSGLQQDRIAIDRTVTDVPGLVQALQSVDQQVDHSIQLISFLNRFAHRMDSEESYYSVVDAIDELMVLVSRLARQKSVVLETDFAASIPRIVGSPANLQMLVFFLLDEKIKNLSPKSTVVVRVYEEHGGVMVTIRSSEVSAEDRAQDSRCPRSVLLSVARGMGAEVIDSDDGRETVIVLRGAW